ncbi:RHS repeat domain-containing protein [Chitiniphilus eburneus]|uniref:RHS repeat domain-containing protein n=1 Tax=Chitiniphilus eburneus TaxID=2571148 RepID=UPI0035CF3BD1
MTGLLNNGYSHDAAGHLIGETGWTHRYNDVGRMVQSSQGSTSVTYQYNALGQRVKKAAANTPLFAYDDQGQLLGEYGATGQATQETVWLDNIPVAALLGPTAPKLYYVWADHLGTPRQLSDPQADNKVVWEWAIAEAFGNSQANSDPDGDGQQVTYNLRFPGQYADVETGRYYNYFRDYDPRIGRYIQSDPIGLAGGINSYAYGLNNSLKYVDPLGLMGVDYSQAELAKITAHLTNVARLQGENFFTSPVFSVERDMLKRLYAGMGSSFDVGFFLHESLEADICKKKFAGKNPATMTEGEINYILRQAHEETLKKQQNRSSDLYHPNVIQKNRKYF